MKNKGKILLVASLAIVLGGSVFAWSYVQAVSSLNGIIDAGGSKIYNLQGLSIGTTTQAATGTIILGSGGLTFSNGTTQTTPYLGSSQTITAGNISGPGVFGYPGGSSAYAFPSSVGVGTTTTAGLPNTLSVYGTESVTGALSAATLNTGQGANELYAMNQNVQTTDSPTFAAGTFTGALSASTLNATGKIIYLNGSDRISDAWSASYTRIQPQNNTLILYNGGSSNQQLQVFGASGNQGVTLAGSTSNPTVAGFGAGVNMTVYGGNQASSNLTLDSTSNGTKGYVILAPSGGNVGIGTASPGYTLDVAGQINSSNKITASESSGTTNGGFSFTQDGAQDTGMFSPSDGVVNFYGNAALAEQISGGTVTFPNAVNIGSSNSQLNQTGALNVYNSGGTLLATGYSVQNPVANSGFYAVNTVPYGINYVAGDNSMPYGFAIQDNRMGEHAGFLAVPNLSNGGSTNMVFYVGNDGGNTFQFVPFTWDGTENHLGSPVMTIGAQTGNVNITGTVTAGGFSGPLTGTESAANVSSGSFGGNTGGGNYTFPNNIISTPASNSGGGAWYFGNSAWGGNAPASTGINSVLGMEYIGGTGSQLFTLASSPGQLSLQLDGSVFVGAGIGYNPNAANGASDGYLVVANGGSFGGNLYTNGSFTANGAVSASTNSGWSGGIQLSGSSKDTAVITTGISGGSSGGMLFAATTATGSNTAFSFRDNTEVNHLLDILNNGNVSVSGTLSAANINTGQGANELYAMNQNVQTTDSPTFAGATLGTLAMNGYETVYVPSSQSVIFINKDSGQNSGIRLQTGGGNDWLVGEHTNQNFTLYSYGGNADVFSITSAGNASISGMLGVGGAITGGSLNVGSGAITAGSANISGTVTASTLQMTGANGLTNSAGYQIIQGGNVNDYVRINQNGSFTNGTAMYGPVSIGTAGLNVGSWLANAGAGNIVASGNITAAGATINGSNGLYLTTATGNSSFPAPASLYILNSSTVAGGSVGAYIINNNVGGTGVYSSSTVGVEGAGSQYGVEGVASNDTSAYGVAGYFGKYAVFGYSNGSLGNTAAIYGAAYNGARDFQGVNGEYTNGGVWTNGSSRTLKTDFTSLNKEDILSKIMQLPITKWVYKSDPNQWHIGPMAEDFYPLFGTSNNISIDTESPAAVALIGVQALDEKMNTQQTEINNLKSLVCIDHPSSQYCQ